MLNSPLKNKGQIKESDREYMVENIAVKLLRKRSSYINYQLDRQAIDNCLYLSHIQNSSPGLLIANSVRSEDKALEYKIHKNKLKESTSLKVTNDISFLLSKIVKGRLASAKNKEEIFISMKDIKPSWNECFNQ
jgi:hypothetical protein